MTYGQVILILFVVLIGYYGFLIFMDIQHLKAAEAAAQEDYLEWCQTHGTDPSDESAEFYVEQTDIDQMDRQVMDDESYGVWN